MAGIVKRSIDIVGETCLLGFGGRDYVKSAVFDATTLTPGGTDEVQTLAITGTPSGGDFTLTYEGETTTDIAFNATAAAVEAALEALSEIGAGDVVGSGGPLPGTPVVITFQGALASQDVGAITVDDAGLTGGTAPAATVVETTKGSAESADLYFVKSGTVVMKTAAGDKVEEWDGGDAADILGIVDGYFEFMGPVEQASREVPVYGRLATFDSSKIRGYVANEADLKTWAATVDAKFEEGIT